MSNLLNVKQIFRIGQVIVQIGTKNKPTPTATMAPIINEAISYPDFFSA